MIQSTVVLVGYLKRGNQRDQVPLLVEQLAASRRLKELSCFRVVGGFFRPMNHWCIMVFYEGLQVGDSSMDTLRRGLAPFCQDGRTYEHVEPMAEPLVPEASLDHPGGPWIWETRICYFGGSIYRLMWDDLAHFENAKRYAPVVDDVLEATEIVDPGNNKNTATALIHCNALR